jgi:alkaline phosphatase D
MSKLILGPIVGGLSHTKANIWGRAAGEGSLHAWIGHQSDLSDAKLWGQSAPLHPDDAYAGVAPIDGLQAATHYYYALTLSPEHPDGEPGDFPSFTTFPEPGKLRSFSFVFGSCFCPETDDGGAIFSQILKLQAKSAADPVRALRFMLMLGDQIYADVHHHNGLDCQGAHTWEDYCQVYEYNWTRPPLQKLLPRIPLFMTLDDHEVDDDWTWTSANRVRARVPIWDFIKRLWHGCNWQEFILTKQRVQAALRAYWEHQGMHARTYVNGPRVEKRHYPMYPSDPGSLAYVFEYGAAAFFVMDTRTHRIRRWYAPNKMLGDEQWTALEEWLLDVKDTHPVKFIATSGALLFQMWMDVPRDRWTGFPSERRRLLKFLAQNEIEGVYFLTGDLHSAHAVSADLNTPSGKKIPIWEFCSSPFEQETNWLAKYKYSYVPIRTHWLSNQKKWFVCDDHNFGVVRVEFGADKQPNVHLEIHRQPIALDTSK